MKKGLFLFFMFFLVATKASAIGTFIPAPNRIDTVYDSERNRLYISSGDQVLRYDMTTDAFLTPFVLGGALRGMDLSPDGNTLVVADGSIPDAPSMYLVDLTSDTWRQVRFTPSFSEAGTWSVAFGNDGRIMVTTGFQGSGWVPLRRYDADSDTTDVLIPLISDWTMATASGDGSVIGFAEANISDGRWGVYYVPTAQVVERTGYTDGTSWFNYEIGVNHDGTQYAIPTYGGTFLYDSSFKKIATIGTYAGPQPMGVVYHPVENRAYFPWVGTTEVREYDTTTFSQVGTYDFENAFTNPGNWAYVQGRMKISRDGSLLFATVNGGVRYVRLYDSLAASDQIVETTQNTEAAITLDGSIGNGGALTFTLDTRPNSGTLTGTAPDLVYAPNPDFTGTDSFSYHVSYGRATAAATVTVNISPLGGPLSTSGADI